MTSFSSARLFPSLSFFHDLVSSLALAVGEAVFNFRALSSIQSSLGFFIPFLISLYFAAPSVFFSFFQSLLVSHISRISYVAQGLDFRRCFPRMSLAVPSITALKLVVIASRFSQWCKLPANCCLE